MAKRRTKPAAGDDVPVTQEELTRADREHTASGEKTYIGPIARHDIGGLVLDTLAVQDAVCVVRQAYIAGLDFVACLRRVARLAANLSVRAEYYATRALLQERIPEDSPAPVEVQDDETVNLADAPGLPPEEKGKEAK